MTFPARADGTFSLVKHDVGPGQWPRESPAKYRIGRRMNRAMVIGNRVEALFQSSLPHENNCGFMQKYVFRLRVSVDCNSNGATVFGRVIQGGFQIGKRPAPDFAVAPSGLQDAPSVRRRGSALDQRRQDLVELFNRDPAR